MASNPPVAVYDACVLYPFHLRNILIQCAFDGLVEARWTDLQNGELVTSQSGRSKNFWVAIRELSCDEDQ